MRITYGKLRHLPVVTERGAGLGHVFDIELDAESHAISAYLVQTGLRMFGPTLRIAPAEVVSITGERMVVKDTAVPAMEKLAARATPVAAV